MREPKQRWKQKELSEVPFMTADSFIGTCRRGTLLIIHTHVLYVLLWNKTSQSPQLMSPPPSFSSHVSTSGRFFLSNSSEHVSEPWLAAPQAPGLLPPQPASVSSRWFLNNSKVQNNWSHCRNWCAVSFNGSQSPGNSGQIQNRVLTSLHSEGLMGGGVSGAALIYG